MPKLLRRSQYVNSTNADHSWYEHLGLVRLDQVTDLQLNHLALVQQIGTTRLAGKAIDKQLIWQGVPTLDKLRELLVWHDMSRQGNVDAAKRGALCRQTGLSGVHYKSCQLDQSVTGYQAYQLGALIFDGDPGLLTLLEMLPGVQIILYPSISHDSAADDSEPRPDIMKCGWRGLVFTKNWTRARQAKLVYQAADHFDVGGGVNVVGLAPSWFDRHVRETGVWVRPGDGFDATQWLASLPIEYLQPKEPTKAKQKRAARRPRLQGPVAKLLKAESALAKFTAIVQPPEGTKLILDSETGLPQLIQLAGYGERSQAISIIEHHFKIKKAQGRVQTMQWIYRIMVEAKIAQPSLALGADLSEFKQWLLKQGMRAATDRFGRKVWFLNGVDAIYERQLAKLWTGLRLLAGFRELRSDDHALLVKADDMAEWFGLSARKLNNALKMLGLVGLLSRRHGSYGYTLHSIAGGTTQASE